MDSLDGIFYFFIFNDFLTVSYMCTMHSGYSLLYSSIFSFPVLLILILPTCVFPHDFWFCRGIHLVNQSHLCDHWLGISTGALWSRWWLHSCRQQFSFSELIHGGGKGTPESLPPLKSGCWLVYSSADKVPSSISLEC